MIIGKIYCKEDSFKDFYEVMKEFPFKIDNFDSDLEKIFSVVYYNNIPVCGGMLVSKGENYILQNIFTVEKFRNMGFADLACKLLIRKTFDNFADKIFAFPDSENEKFFYKLGFKYTDDLTQKNIKKMVLELKEYLNHSCNF